MWPNRQAEMAQLPEEQCAHHDRQTDRTTDRHNSNRNKLTWSGKKSRRTGTLTWSGRDSRRRTEAERERRPPGPASTAEPTRSCIKSPPDNTKPCSCPQATHSSSAPGVHPQQLPPTRSCVHNVQGPTCVNAHKQSFQPTQAITKSAWRLWVHARTKESRKG